MREKEIQIAKYEEILKTKDSTIEFKTDQYEQLKSTMAEEVARINKEKESLSVFHKESEAELISKHNKQIEDIENYYEIKLEEKTHEIRNSNKI